jgi:hypothetical protein
MTAKNGWTTALHTTGEVHATDQALRNCLAHGNLAADERAEATRKRREKAARVAAETKANAARTATAAARSKLIETAAGPYAGPEEVPLSWFLAEHPAPWMRWVIITPAIARELMKRNTDNRPFRGTVRDNYRRVIEAGRWHLTHQGMAMDANGVLQDGQHRLQACIDTDTAITTAFTVGCPVENFKAIDEGRNRSVADLLGKAGETDVNLLGTSVRLIAASREPYPHAFLKNKSPNEVLYDAFKGDPDRLREACRWGRAHAQNARIVGSALVAGRYLLREANGEDNDYVQAFLQGLVTGTKGDSRILLDADDPRLLLRQQLQVRRERGQRTRAVDQLGMIIWAWNGVVSGRRFRHVKWAEFSANVPPITVCRDSGRTASAPPDLLRGEFTIGGDK